MCFLDRCRLADADLGAKRNEYRALLELLVDALARKEVATLRLVEVHAADDGFSIWHYLEVTGFVHDDCPRCGLRPRVYWRGASRLFALFCRSCLTLEVLDYPDKRTALVAGTHVATKNSSATSTPQAPLEDPPLSRSSGGRTLPFVAIWPLGPDRRTQTAWPRPPWSADRSWVKAG